MAQPKVYEFAKEIGVETITLMDKLRKWDLPIKSHMSALSPEQIETIKEKLKTEGGDVAPAASAKKKVAKKKTAAKKKTVAKKKATASKKVVKKKSDSSASADDKSRKIIRRKAGAAQQAEKAIEAAEAKKKSKELAAQKEAEAKAAEAAALEAAAAQENTEVETDEQVTAVQEVAQETEAQAAAAPEEVAEAPRELTEVEKVSEKIEEKQKEKRKAMQEKRRGKILGKVDLSKIKPPASARNKTDRPPRGGSAGGSRPNVNLDQQAAASAGPVGARDKKSAPRMKSVDMSRDARGAAAAAAKKKGNLKGADEQTRLMSEGSAFNRTEFRKREIVFQPKKKMQDLGREAMKTEITKPKASKRIVKVHGSMKVADLAQEMKVKTGQLVSFLMKQGIQARQNDEVDFDTIALIAPEFDHEAVNTYKTVEELVEETVQMKDENLVPRAPVVTVMGHVDHGKTSILDAIRNANVTEGEAGGITQHIGAYRVKVPNGNMVTFLDTPGHAAFTQMRARGASVTDIAVIVVAADDGLMPQTQEAINHAKAAGVPIIVAVNKMDRPNANPDKIKQQLTEFELIPEEWGGSTMFIETVAIEGKGIPELLEAIDLQAELLELKANPKRSMKGVVIESKMVKGRGIVATILVQDGTLNKSDYLVAGTAFGRVRAMLDDKGKQMKSAGPGVPVEILGLNDSPLAGDEVNTTAKERQAEEIANQRLEEKKAEEQKVKSPKVSLEDLFAGVVNNEVKELPVVLKTDVVGSGEAIKNLFDKEKSEKVKINVIHSAVGGITESDILLASTSGAMVIGFNVGAEGTANNAAKKEGIQIKRYNIIYELADDIRAAMKGMLDPDIVNEDIGQAEVRDLFKVPNLGFIAGCMVTDGKARHDALVRVVRDGKQIYDGKVASLRRFKDQAKEVASGYECGIGIENFNDIKVGDNFEFYVKKEVEAEL